MKKYRLIKSKRLDVVIDTQDMGIGVTVYRSDHSKHVLVSVYLFAIRILIMI